MRAIVPVYLVKKTALPMRDFSSTSTSGSSNSLGNGRRLVRRPNSVHHQHATRLTLIFREMAAGLFSFRFVPEAARSGFATVTARTPFRSLQWAALLRERRAGLRMAKTLPSTLARVGIGTSLWWRPVAASHAD